MKVILLRDVAKIGRRFEVVEVPDGYAQNQLIPKKLAETATPANLKKVTALKETASLHHKLEDDQFAAAVKAIEERPLALEAGQVNAQGHLFKAIHEADIVAAAKARGVVLLGGQIQIKSPIKSLGRHEIVLKHGSVSKVCFVDINKA
jgi:large subunit ribosomal protein L9